MSPEGPLHGPAPPRGRHVPARAHAPRRTQGGRGLRKVCATLIVALATGTASGQTLTLREQDGIAWACGGIGYEERQALQALESHANVVLLFVAGTRGAFVSDVRLRAVSSIDTAIGLEIVADGPICVLRLPPGDWHVEARLGDTVREQRVRLSSGLTKPLRVNLSFPMPAATGPAASPQESSGVGDWGRAGQPR